MPDATMRSGRARGGVVVVMDELNVPDLDIFLLLLELCEKIPK